MLKGIADRIDAWLQPPPAESDPVAILVAYQRDMFGGIAALVDMSITCVEVLAALLAEQAAGVHRSPVDISQQRKTCREQLETLAVIRATAAAALLKLPKEQDCNHGK